MSIGRVSLSFSVQDKVGGGDGVDGSASNSEEEDVDASASKEGEEGVDASIIGDGAGAEGTKALI